MSEVRRKSVLLEETTKRFGYFAKETTLHGFPDVHSSKSTRQKAFWIVVLLISIAAVAYEVYKVVGDYRDRPIITQYDWKSVNAFEFPQVEICSENMINFTKLRELKLHSQIAGMAKLMMPDSLVLPIFEESLGHTVGEIFNYPVYYAVLTQPTKAEAQVQLKKVLNDLRPTETNGTELDGVFAFLEEQLIALFPNETTGNDTDYFALHFESVKKHLNDDGELHVEKFFAAAGFEVNEILISCEFMAEALNCSDIVKTVFDQRYGQCFVIDVQRSQTIGGLGLRLIINSNSAFGIPELPNFSEGIQVRINKQINPASLDILRIPTGTATSIALQPTYFNLEVSENFGRCFDDMERIAITYPYSDTVCRLDCFVNVSMAVCNCSIAIPRAYLKAGFYHRNCMTRADARCINALMQERVAIAHNAIQCVDKCRPSCEYWDYSPTVTYNNFPSKALVRRLLNSKIFGIGIEDFDVKQNILGTDESKSFDDLIILDIAFTEMSYMDVSQQIAITFDGFISQIGGIFGLFLGASLISFVQIASFFALKCFCPLMKTAVHVQHKPESGRIENQGESSRITFTNV